VQQTIPGVRHRTRAGFAVPVALGAALFCSAAANADDLRLGPDVRPTSERVDLVLDADKPDYTGRVGIDLDVKHMVSSFRLHASDMTFKTVSLAQVTKPADAISLQSTPGENGLVTLTATAPIPSGKYVLTIEFANNFNTDATGLYRLKTEGRGYLFTQFEAEDAREAFPCFDEPACKIPWEFTVEVPAAHVVIFNTPIARETTTGATKRIVFKKTPPLPSYLLAIATGPLETVDIPGLGVPGRVVTVQGQKHLTQSAVESTAPILKALEKWFGQKYPFEKLDLLAVPEYWAGAMENPGAITFSTNVLLIDPKTASAQQRRTQYNITAHELAHMWFGDLVTMQWWDDLWLNESFADWMGDKIANQVYPEFRLDVSELSSIQGIMTGDSRPSARAIQHEVKPGDNLLQDVGTAYNKGKAVLGMFERWIGPEQFQRGVRVYLHKHEWGNATAADLWAALSTTSGQDLSAAMQTFLVQPGVPLVSARVLDGGKVELTQQRFASVGVNLPAQQWKIPVPLRWSDGHATWTKTVLLEQPAQTFDLGAKQIAWLLPNADSYGYLRWRVEPGQWAALLEHTRELTPRERIGVIGNSAALLDGGALHGDDYARTLASFRDETDPLVMARVVDSMGKIRTAFVSDDLREPFAAYLRRTLGPALQRFGFDRRPGEDETVSFLRPNLIEWLGEYGEDATVRAHAVEIAAKYVQDPASVDPALGGTALSLAALDGDRARFDTYKAHFESAKVPALRSRFLGALGNFRNPEIVEAALQYSLEGPLRPQEVMSIPGTLARQSERGRDRAFEWITTNYDVIRKRMPEEFGGFLPFIVSGCEQRRQAAIQAFFGDPARVNPAMKVSLKRAADAVADCTNLREREGAGVAAYLQQTVGTR